MHGHCQARRDGYLESGGVVKDQPAAVDGQAQRVTDERPYE